MAEDLERLIVKLDADLRSYEKALAKAQKTTVTQIRRMETEAKVGATRIERALGNIKPKLTGFGKGFLLGAVSAAVTALSAAGGDAVRIIGDIKDAADKAGVSVKQLQQLTFAGLGAGVSQDELVSGLEKFNKVLGESILKGGKGLANFFEANGVALHKQNGELRDTADLFVELADLINGLSSEQEKTVVATAALGKAGAEMLPFFKQGSAAIRQMGEEAQSAGAVFSDALVARADDFGDRWSFRVRAWRNLFLGAIADIILELGALIDAVTEPLIKFDNFLREQTGKGLFIKPLSEIMTPGGKKPKGLETTVFGNGTNQPPTRGLNNLVTNTAADKAAKDAERQAKATTDVIEQLKFEQEQLGRTALQQEIYNQIKDAGVDITSKQGQEIVNLVTAIEQEKLAQEAANEALNEFKSLSEDVFRDILQNIRDGASAGDILAGVIDKITSKMLDLAASNLTEGLFGTTAGGGFLGSLLGLKKFARGGITKGPAIFGEQGAEAAVPLPDGRSIPVDLRLPKGLGAPQMSVKIENHAGARVSTQMGRGSNGPELRVMIRSAVGEDLATGRHDKAMGARFGVKPAGLRRT